MAPEQAKGEAIDKRADIWAFGVVLFEMLTGRAPFSGEHITDVMAQILWRDPDWTLLLPETPTGVRNLLRRCLERDPKLRLENIGDARVDLERRDLSSPEPMRAAKDQSLLIPSVAVGIALFVAGAFSGWMLGRRSRRTAGEP